MFDIGIDKLLSGVGSLFSGGAAFSSLFDNSYDQISEKNRQWQSEENQKNRDFQSSEWTRQFDMTNAYNDPSNQRARLAKAGINPALAFQGSAGGLGQSFASPSAPSGASSSVTTPFSDAVMTSRYQSAESFAKSLESLSKIVPNKISGDVMRANEDLIKTQAQREKVKLQMDDFDYSMQLVYGEALKNQEVNNALARYKNTLQDTLLKIEEGKEVDAKILESEGRRLLMQTQREVHGSERDLLRKKIAWYDDDIRSQIKERNSSAARNYAESSQINFWNDLYNDERDYLVKNIHNDAAQKFQNVRMTENQRDLLHYHIQQAKYANDNKEIKFWNDLIMQDLGVASDIVQDFTRLSSFKSLSKAQQDKVRLEEQKFRYDTETFEDTYNRYDSQGRKHTVKGRRKMDGTVWQGSSND